MRLSSKFLTLIFATFMLAGGLVVSAEAQSRGSVTVQRTTTRPVVVRRVVYRDPFWRSRYLGYSRYYDPFYDPYYYSPYLQYQDQKIRLQNELAGNRRELAKHLSKYRADGVITAKEERELADDRKDVRNSELRLRQFNSNYANY
jgi:hypothetical protein